MTAAQEPRAGEVGVFAPEFYAELEAHAWAALREGKPFQFNADAALAIIRQAAQDRAALRTQAPAREGETFRLLQLADAALANVTAFETDARYIMGNTNYEITDHARSEIRQFLLSAAALSRQHQEGEGRE